MGHLHEVYFVILAFFSELIGTLSGVSSSTLFVPIAHFFESVQITLVFTAVLHVLGNTIRTIMYYKNINWPLVIKFGLPAIVFTALGAQYSDFLSQKIYSIILGIFLVSTSVYLLFFNSNKIFSGRWLPFIGGGLSGLLTGLLGSGGAVRSLALTVFNLNPLTFIATSTLIDFGGDIVRLIIYIQKGYLNIGHYFYIPILMIVALIANWIAKYFVSKMPENYFRKVVLWFVFGMGMFSIVTAII